MLQGHKFRDNQLSEQQAASELRILKQHWRWCMRILYVQEDSNLEEMVLSKLFSIVVLQVLDSFQKGISSNFRSVIPASPGKTIKIGERGRQAFYYVHSDYSDGQYVNLFLLSFCNFQHQIFLSTANCFAKLKQMQSFKKVEQEFFFVKTIFCSTKNSYFATFDLHQ